MNTSFCCARQLVSDRHWFHRQTHNYMRDRIQEEEKKEMAAAEGVCLNHISRETVDVERLAKFYQEILGFERIESPKFGEFQVVWMKLPPAFSLHIIQRNPEIMLPEGPWSSTGAIADPKNLPRGHHVSFSVSNYESFVQTLKDKGIAVFEKTQPDGKTKQVFFFDPDGNGLEVGSWEAPKVSEN